MFNRSYKRAAPGFLILLFAGMIIFLVVQKQTKETIDSHNWVEGWREVSSFKIPRRGPASVISGKFIYILGGVNNQDQYVRSVEFSRINDNGDLDGWKITSHLREGRFYLGAATDGNYLYAMGGGGGPIGDDNIPLASVERAVINPDGSLGEWQHHSYLTTPRRGLKVEMFNGQLYAIGGYNGRFLRSTERLNVGSDTQWKLEENEAQIDRYIHATARIDNRLYLLGGHVEKAGNMSYGDVESSRIKSDGSIEPWRTSPSRLINARFIATAFTLGNRLYLVGGHNGSQRLDSVEMTTVAQNGDANTWSLISPMLYKRSAATSAVIGNRVYALGGMGDQGALRTVETAILGPNGKLGHLIHK